MLSSMQGSQGIGANLNNWTAEDFSDRQASDHRLSPASNERSSAAISTVFISPRAGSEFLRDANGLGRQKISPSFSPLPNATQEGRGFPLLQLQGLDPNAEYNLSWIEGKAVPGTPEGASGAWCRCATAFSSIFAAISKPPHSGWIASTKSQFLRFSRKPRKLLL